MRSVEPCFLGERGVADDDGVLAGVFDNDNLLAPVAAQHDKQKPGLEPGEVLRLVDNQHVEVQLDLGELHLDVGRRHCGRRSATCVKTN